MELLNLLKKYKIYDENNFMKYRQNLYDYIESISNKDILKIYEEDNIYKELVEITKKQYEKDLFSEMFMELGTNSKGLKQLFTPFSVSKLMSEIVKNNNGLIYEPTCGTGANIFPVMAEWSKQNIVTKFLDKKNYQNHFVIAQDLDPVNCAITALNLSLRGINGLVLNMDTLENKEIKECYMTFNENGLAGLSSIWKYNKKDALNKIYNFWITNFFNENGNLQMRFDI